LQKKPSLCAAGMKNAKYYAFCICIVYLILAQSQVLSISNLDYLPTSLGSTVTANVKSFGAAGDGISDDSAAIQKAIDSLSRTGGTVFLPAGTYRIGAGVLDKVSGLSVALRIGSFVNLLGDGAGKSIMKVDPNVSSTLNRFLINDKPGDSNISISRLTIDTANTPVSKGSGAGLSFVKSKNIAIEDVEFKNVKKEAIDLLSVSNFTIRNNVVYNTWTGISLRDCSNGDVVDNAITSTGGDGIIVMSEAHDRCTDLHIKSNNINAVNDTAIDIDTHDGSGHHENIIVSENIIENNLASAVSVGIRASQSSNIIISNNIIKNASLGILLDTPTAPPKSISVSGNIIDDFTNYGIIAAYDGAIIDGNSIYGTDGVVADGNNSTISGVSPVRLKVGIALKSQSLDIVNNHIENVDYGVRWEGDSSSCIIGGNIILSANIYGISDDPEKNFNIQSHVVSNNIIFDNRSPHKMVRGINFGGLSTHNMNIISNKIIGFVSDPAIKLINGDNQLSFNEIDGELPSGNFAIEKGTSNETITINNKHVTSSSLITLTFDSDPDTIDNLYVYSRSPGSSFDIRVNTHKPTTNEVKVAYMIVN
jgi:parallel beta-helix repeat protein